MWVSKALFFSCIFEVCKHFGYMLSEVFLGIWISVKGAKVDQTDQIG
jgi:hypothetical protein